MKYKLLFASLLISGTTMVATAQQQRMKPEETEIWEPVPKQVTPGKNFSEPPSDAIVLFNGKDLSQWVMTNDTTTPAQWTVANGVLTVKKDKGNIQTKQSFQD